MKFQSFYTKVIINLSKYFIIDIHDSLLKKVNISLLIFEHEIIDLDTGESQLIDDYSAESILSGATQLIPKSIKKPSIALFLPSSEFVSIPYQLPQVEKHNILSVLKYQQTELLPECQQSLLVAAKHDSLSTDNRAIWFSKQRANTLFEIFIKHNIRISSLFPASLLFATTNKHSQTAQQKYDIFCEQGEDYFLLTQFVHQQLKNWDFFYRKDLQQKDLKLQFQELWDSKYPDIDFSSVDIINNKEKWLQIAGKALPQKEYGFYPEQAETFITQESRFRKGRFSGIILLLLVFLLSIPFLKNMLQLNQLQQAYNDKVVQTKDVRIARESVLNYEDNWAAFDQFPQINIPQILLKINILIPKNSWLSSFELNKGIINIEGYSPNPAEILELLSRLEEFDQVRFNQNIRSERGKNKEHFGITFRLIAIDEDTYYKEFFSYEE